MSIIKKWSTGRLGNEFPDHSDRGNPNTRGLTTDNLPGIEAYIEEDDVVAGDDNRPIKNLSENDVILEGDLIDVASEVDYGVLKGRYNEFSLDVEDYESLLNPNLGSSDYIDITPLRVNSGSIFINGSVVRIGNQKIIYFIKTIDGNEVEFLFPNYDEFQTNVVTTIYDPEFRGEYIPVFGTMADSLPSNFDEFEIKIVNSYSDNTPDRILYYEKYRDWEDLTPYPPDESSQDPTPLNFKYDSNFGQDSEGVWLQPNEDLINIKVSDIEVKKDIQVNDKLFSSEDFKFNATTGNWESVLITDGIFFDNVIWESNINNDVKSLFVDNDDNIYFIYDFIDKEIPDSGISLYRITAGSDQVLRIPILDLSGGKLPTKIQNVEEYLFVLGINGLIRFLKIGYEETLSSFNNLTIDEDVTSVAIWEDELWISSETKVYRANYSSFLADPSNTNFDVIDISNELSVGYDFENLKEIQGLYPIKGNYVVNSSLIDNIDNLIKNPSFEDGGIGNRPVHWSAASTTDEEGTSSSLFKIGSGNSLYGQMRGILSPSSGDTYSWVYQIVEHEFNINEDWTLSAYIKSSNLDDIILTITEFDESDNQLSSTNMTQQISTVDIWERMSVTHNVQNGGVRLRIEIRKSGTSKLQIDGAQLEIGQEAHQFVYGFDYLMIAFRKESDTTNPPFAFIDSRSKYDIHYTPGVHGDVLSINDILDVGHNEIKVLSDKNIYNFHFLNNIDSYDRINISNVTESLFGDDFKDRINNLNTIEEMDGRTYIGSSILNKTISFTISDGYEHNVEMLPPERGDNVSNFMEIIGDYSFIQATETSPAFLEFEYTHPLLESSSNASLYEYEPNTSYGFRIKIDGGTKSEKVAKYILPVSPSKNQGPWSLNDIKQKIETTQSNNNLFDESSIGYTLNWKYDTSTTKIDGFYSIGKNKPTRYLRGNIKQIFKQKNILTRSKENRFLYVIRDNTILKLKYDPNIKKIGNSYPKEPGNITGYVDSFEQLPSSVSDELVYYVSGWGYYKWSMSQNSWVNTNYFHRWNLYNDDYEIREFKKVSNRQITFNDTTSDKLWTNIPTDTNFSILDGSLRVKIGESTEYGFIDGMDYFVDYENHKIIRNSSQNFLNDPKFEFVSSQSSKWKKWSNYSDIVLMSSGDGAKVYLDGSTWEYGSISQTYTPSTIGIGQTYTFSIYVKSHIPTTFDIILSEINSTDTGSASPTSYGENFDYANRSSSNQITVPLNIDSKFGEWKRYEVSHTISEDDSDGLRVEFKIQDDYEIFIKDAQLERNSYSTPFIVRNSYSRIDPNDTVYVDFVQFKSLEEDIEFEFDHEGRRVCLKYEPDTNSEFFFDYKYERIFNPYRFGNSLPRFDVKYDAKDDYFLYENSGRVWAINQILALLSLDENNPIHVSYRYYYPRVDKIKIRNNPDKYGNFLYYVKGSMSPNNPYSPIDNGLQRQSNVEGRLIEDYTEMELESIDTDNNDTLYEINVTSYDFDKNDIYDRRIFVESESSPYYNISLQGETLAYFPFEKDFVSTNGLHPLLPVEKSRITSIVKNYSIKQNEEVGAWSSNYDIGLRYKDGYPEKIGISLSTFVNPDTGQDNNPSYDGRSKIFPFKTISKALQAVKDGTHHPNIIITSTKTIYENIEIEIETVENVLIKAETYFKWRGNFYNKSSVTFQGIIFENFNHYVASNLSFYHCDFIDSSISNFYPMTINFYNCKMEDVKNTFLNVNASIFPNVFIHPYMKSDSRNDGVDDNSTIATSDFESIFPNEEGYNFSVAGSPRGYYTFYRCLINRVNEDIIDYNIGTDKDWKSDFTFEKCTIVNSQNLFRTKNPGQNILYNECIIWNDGFYSEGRRYWFDSVSSIELLNTFVDFEPDTEILESRFINYNPLGELFGRETCEFSGPDIDPGFIETDKSEIENYHLKSVAKGFLFDSPAISMASDGGDIGAYDEIRERLDINIPTKFKSNFALIQESIIYPIIVNSEKITVTFEFKPTNQYSESGIIFDTRSSETDEDYIILAYNNNGPESITNPKQDPDAEETNQYSFKLILANKLESYAVVSPLKIDSDSEFQVWHRISFTVNYEKTFNQKASFDEKDKYQNIVTFYHNDQIAVESFFKDDLNRDEKGEILLNKFSLLDPEERAQYSEEEISNNWNFNNISDFITIGGAFDNTSLISGYYAEFRIDNKFTNRKELRAWNQKKLPFNDPDSFVDESTLVKTIDSGILNEYWSLRDEYGVGAKGNKFDDKTARRLTYDRGEIVWSLSEPTVNLIQNSDFEVNQLAHVTADEKMDLPANMSKRMFVRAENSRVSFDSNGNEDLGIEIRFYFDKDAASTGIDFNSKNDVVKHIRNEIFRVDEFGSKINGDTQIDVRMTHDDRIEFYTKDWSASSLEVFWENPGDPYEMGFVGDRLQDWMYEGESGTAGENVYFVDSMRSDSYTPNGTPAYPFKYFSNARTFLEEGIVVKVVNGQTTINSLYSDFGIDSSGASTAQFQGKRISEAKESDIEVVGIVPDSLDRHEVWVEFNSIYSRLSGNALGIKKKFLEDTHLMVLFDKIKNEQNQETKLSIGVPYTLSLYVNSKDEVNNNKIRFVRKENGVITESPYETFDSIEKVFGDWFKITKNIDSFSSEDAKIGLVVLSDFEIYVDAVQLEQSKFSTPYIKTRSDEQGVIEINKSVLSEESGIIFFRFKPVLNWSTDEKITILHAIRYQTSDGDLVYQNNSDYPTLNRDKGFQITYEYNSTIERGILEFKTNQLDQNDNSTHRFYVPEVLWDKWHSVAIYYNYPTNRFIYFFDHFKQDIESVATLDPFGSNLYIGRDVPKIYTSSGDLEWLNSGGDRNRPSANILVKDVILTNYTVSEKEIENWINAKEFYKESSFSHLLNEYKLEILQRINNIEAASSNNDEVLAKIDSFEDNLYNFEQNINNSVNTEIPKIQADVSNNSTSITSHEGRLNTAESQISSLQSEQSVQNSRLDDTELVSNNNYDLITDETQNRTDADQYILDSLSSNHLGDGASTVGIHDGANRFSSTNVEGALQELAGKDRNATHTVKGNFDLILQNLDQFSAMEIDLSYALDGENVVGYQTFNSTNNPTSSTEGQYTFSLAIDGVDSDGDLTVDLGDDETFSNIVSQITSAMYFDDNITGMATVFIDGDGKIRITSDSNGSSSTVVISEPSSGSSLLTLLGGVDSASDGKSRSWTREKAKNNGLNIVDLKSDINNNNSDISNLQSDLTQEVSDRQQADQNILSDFASTAGASMIGVEDANDLFTQTTIESVLGEITGIGRTNQSIKSNYDAIISNDNDISNIQNDISTINTNLLEIGKVKDGDDGSSWNDTMNLKSHDDIIATNSSDISNNSTAISQNGVKITNNEDAITTVSNNLTSEVNDRQLADQSILNTLSSTATGSGASLIGISDMENTFTSTTVEGALSEIDEKLKTLESSLSWQEPVDTKSDLPMSDNSMGDARTVIDDGDGFAAQYVWNGTSWVKIADINWGEASDITFDNSLTSMDSTNVQDAIVEAYEKAQDTTKAEDSVESTAWSSGADGKYFHDIEHELGTYDVTVLPTSSADGRVVGVDEVETISPEVTRVWVTDNSEGLDFTVFGGVNNYSKVVGNWTTSGGDGDLYYHTLQHNLNTTKLMYSIFDQSTGKKTNVEEFVFTDTNTITIWTNDNLAQLNVFLLKKTSDTKIKDIDNWIATNGMYIASIKMPEEFDAVYSFIDANGRATDVDDIWFDNGFLKIKSTSDEKLRLVILK